MKCNYMEDQDYLDTEAYSFLRIIREMPVTMIYRLIHYYNIDVPFDLRSNQLPEFLYDEIDSDVRKEILDNYQDAGKALCYFFRLDTPTPSLEELTTKSDAIISLKRDETIFQNVPYFDRIEVHNSTETLRVRFHYYKGRTRLYDRASQTLKEYLPVLPGVVIFRPRKKLVEVRAKHSSLCKRAAISSSIALNLKAPHPLNMLNEIYVERFLQWIDSLNNARFEFDVRKVISSLSMSARGRVDLRKVDEFRKYLREGILRGGHATINVDENRKIKFRIFFRNCRIYFTAFSNEEDIEIVADALEKIGEGYRFETPKRLIEDYLK